MQTFVKGSLVVRKNLQAIAVIVYPVNECKKEKLDGQEDGLFLNLYLKDNKMLFNFKLFIYAAFAGYPPEKVDWDSVDRFIRDYERKGSEEIEWPTKEHSNMPQSNTEKL